MQASLPQIVRDTDQVRRLLRGWRGAGSTVALAALGNRCHEGHVRLIETGKRHATRVMVAISGELDAASLSQLAGASCDLIFAPTPAPATTQINLSAKDLGDGDALDAMATAMARLINQVQPDVAIIGERDWQQLVSVRQMVRDLAMPVGIVSAPILREADGLAVSTGNAELTPEERQIAPTLHKTMTASAALIVRGQPIDQVLAASGRFLEASGFSNIDYFTARRAFDLAPLDGFSRTTPARLLCAAHLGSVRLTDNVAIV